MCVCVYIPHPCVSYAGSIRPLSELLDPHEGYFIQFKLNRFFPSPQGWLRAMLRDDGPVEQQNVCRQGDSTEQSVQTAPEGEGIGDCGTQCVFVCLPPPVTNELAQRLSFYRRSPMRLNCTKPCLTSTW